MSTLPPTAPVLDLHPEVEGERRYLNRELTWLSFNERVLALAKDPQLPLLERAKFVAIFAGNLDEFFQVRVAGLLEQAQRGITGSPPDGMTPDEQLDAVRRYAADLVAEQSRIVHEEVLPQLAQEGIHLPRWHELSDEDRAHLVTEFEERVYPVLTPLAVDPAHPFPYISNLSLNLAVEVRDPVTGETRFARVKVPPILPRFVELPDGLRFVPLEQVIAANLDRLFPGLEVVDHQVFRVTRNADMDVEEDEADDLLRAIETELTRRRFGQVVRLEVEPDMPDATRRLLQRELGIGDQAVDVVEGPLDMSGMWALVGVDRPDLHLPTFRGVTPRELVGARNDPDELFDAIRAGDVLLQHPYDAFETTVQAFVEAAARDPKVLAIKMTLYRTSGPGSPIVRSLLHAAEEGKQVVALVELKARFDEEANIEWARVLEEAGVHVAYGVVGLKTHTKIALAVRDDGDVIRRYAHIGTGNYNDKTATIYEDLGVLTADPDLGADMSDLFNVLTGYSRQSTYRKLLVSPTSLAPRLLELIEQEASLGPDGHIVLKMNSLVDSDTIDALYEASRAGTRVDIIVRGICCLRAGVPGMSENITVRSVVGRYLEHSRIYRFGTPDRDRTHLIGSADLMPRNLYRRVEAVAPVDSPPLQQRLDEVLDLLLADNRLAWEQASDGSWSRVEQQEGDPAVETHAALQAAAHDRVRPRLVDDVATDGAIRAAGGVVVRTTPRGREVLVVHRPRYDDWSLPKGKLDAGEDWEAAARREVQEETGVTALLGRELSPVHYTDRKGNPKTVRWWVMTPVEGSPRTRGVDREVDRSKWLPVDEARDLLSYDTDVALLDELEAGPRPSTDALPGVAPTPRATEDDTVRLDTPSAPPVHERVPGPREDG